MPVVPAYATFQDVADLYEQDLPDTAVDRVTRLLALAQTRLLVKAPWIPDRIAAGTLDKAAVVGLLAEVVLRVVRNPNAAMQSETAGEFSYRVNGEYVSGSVVITPADLAQLQPVEATAWVGTIWLRDGR